MPDDDAIDRLSVRERPRGWPVMYQTWDKLLFLHWPIEANRLRPLIPAGLEIDTWQGTAWIGMTPFTINGIRPPLVPPLPLISASHELNVRTYVHRDGIPGVWFLSLDASNRFAVWAARLGYSLPYFSADIEMHTYQDRIDFRSVRSDPSAAAEFQATWQMTGMLPSAAPQTRDFFLIERYCLYSSGSRGLYRARIHHRPWPLRSANVESLAAASMLRLHGLDIPEQPPLVHAQAEPLRVEIWPPVPVADA